MLIGRGTFSPGQGHEMRGSFTLTQTTDGVLMETSADFFFDGSPLPGFALTTGIPSDRDDPGLQRDVVETRFLDLPGDLVEVHGTQVGTIPATISLDSYDTLILWCFATPFILGYGHIERV